MPFSYLVMGFSFIILGLQPSLARVGFRCLFRVLYCSSLRFEFNFLHLISYCVFSLCLVSLAFVFLPLSRLSVFILLLSFIYCIVQC